MLERFNYGCLWLGRESVIATFGTINGQILSMNKSCAVVSPSLLRSSPKPSVSVEHYQSFCLGLPEWCPCSIKMAERKRKPLSRKWPRGDQDDKENDDYE